MADIKKAYLAWDTAYDEGVVILMSNEDIIYSNILATKHSHGKLLGQALLEALSLVNEQGYCLSGLFCGLGPGSFIGERIALATALGFAFARDLPLMGFCSHLAIANSLPQTESVYVFMKASGNLGYLTKFGQINHYINVIDSTKVVDISELMNCIDKNTSIICDQLDKLSLVVGPQVRLIKTFGPTPQGIFKVVQGKLRNGSMVDESNLIKPNYVKAPNISMPKSQFIPIS